MYELGELDELGGLDKFDELGELDELVLTEQTCQKAPIAQSLFWLPKILSFVLAPQNIFLCFGLSKIFSYFLAPKKISYVLVPKFCFLCLVS